MSPAKVPFLQRRYHVPLIVGILLAAHGGLLAYSATRHSPTSLEPPLLVAGLSHWEFRRFELYRVNPPLVRIVAALPVLAVGYQADWSGFFEAPGARPEFQVGADFIAANGERSIWLITLARWACIPFSLLGGLFAFGYARELWRSEAAGLLTLGIWCFEPNILAHAELITNDIACTTFGLGATWLFWRWLRQPAWDRALLAGLLLGVAQLAKSSWLILFALWPTLTVAWWLLPGTSPSNLSKPLKDRPPGPPAHQAPRPGPLQLASLLLTGLAVLNAGYLFDGSFASLDEYQFVSAALNGSESGQTGNRFTGSLWGRLPVPLPRQYLLGLDSQKRDLESWSRPNYLRGQWKPGGWWYYYLYGMLVKLPHGLQLLVAMALLWPPWEWSGAGNRKVRAAAPHAANSRVPSSSAGPHFAKENAGFLETPSGDSKPCVEVSMTCRASIREQFILLSPGLAILFVASVQVRLNEHFRYVLPAIGVLIIFAGRAIYFCRQLTPRFANR